MIPTHCRFATLVRSPMPLDMISDWMFKFKFISNGTLSADQGLNCLKCIIVARGCGAEYHIVVMVNSVYNESLIFIQ